MNWKKLSTMPFLSKMVNNSIYTTNDYVIMTDGQERRKIEEAKPEEEKDPNYIPVTDPIKYYDQIITKGKDLHDGKDYSE